MQRFEDWFTNLCLDIYDWYTSGIVDLHKDLEHARKLLEET